MFTYVRNLWFKFINDELFFRRWGRALIMTLAVSGGFYADQIAALFSAPHLVTALKAAAVACAFASAAITAGEKNPPPGAP